MVQFNFMLFIRRLLISYVNKEMVLNLFTLREGRNSRFRRIMINISLFHLKGRRKIVSFKVIREDC